jgi:hypothetical protein
MAAGLLSQYASCTDELQRAPLKKTFNVFLPQRTSTRTALPSQTVQGKFSFPANFREKKMFLFPKVSVFSPAAFRRRVSSAPIAKEHYCEDSSFNGNTRTRSSTPKKPAITDTNHQNTGALPFSFFH